MSFKDKKDKKFLSSSDLGVSEEELNELLRRINALKKIKDCLEYLYEDIIQVQALGFSFKCSLSTSEYIHANNYACSCLNLGLSCRNVLDNDAKDWISNAIICFDTLIVHYISSVRKEVIYSQTGKLKERDSYFHLESKGGNLATIGSCFNAVYQFRSQLAHPRYKNNTNGFRTIIPTSNKVKKQALQGSIQLLKRGLKLLLNEYKSSYPNC
ncbi:hypothetical protein [Aureispira sp. CCB-E]|uniref:hypothetical protein n=1 Tax=Aureispira sp. CCB-E TaxID=3051121 RepID=UPI0028692D74|nr:hypothetical protein [Aureispira sp. CCB-E]WMX16520.1 hypothetical protein QP953_09090 [Aureispira sp. CCB-E]